MEYIQFIVTIIIILVIFYIANYAKRKQDQEIKKMQDEIKVGDKIVTYTGLSGEVAEVLEDRAIVKLYPNNIEVSIEKWVIAGLDDRYTENKKIADKAKNEVKDEKND